MLGLLLALALSGCRGDSGQVAAGSGGALGWEDDLAQAISRAEREKKLVMIDFYTDWCGWCRKMDQTTFADSTVQNALKRVVPIKLNAEKAGRESASRFNVDGYPTILFLDAKGGEVGRIPGYMPPGPFLQELDDILKRA
jgi:thiol:disulfide interchange protein